MAYCENLKKFHAGYYLIRVRIFKKFKIVNTRMLGAYRQIGNATVGVFGNIVFKNILNIPLFGKIHFVRFNYT